MGLFDLNKWTNEPYRELCSLCSYIMCANVVLSVQYIAIALVASLEWPLTWRMSCARAFGTVQCAYRHQTVQRSNVYMSTRHLISCYVLTVVWYLHIRLTGTQRDVTRAGDRLHTPLSCLREYRSPVAPLSCALEIFMDFVVYNNRLQQMHYFFALFSSAVYNFREH